MKVIICGGRDFTDWDLFRSSLDDMALPITEINHGGARGADSMAARYGRERHIRVVKWLADWAKYGKAAGPKRNRIMLDRVKPDLVIAFPGGKGTADMIRVARKAKVQVVRIEDPNHHFSEFQNKPAGEKPE